MTTAVAPLPHATRQPLRIDVAPALDARDRLTVAFRPFLAIPHLLLVGGPLAVLLSFAASDDRDMRAGMGGGAFGAVAVAIVIVAWFAILFTGAYPRGLRNLLVFYLRWRVRAVAYVTLLRDEYPPFGEGRYPASLAVEEPDAPRNRWSVAFRFLLVLPHLLALWVLGVAWCVSTIVAWFAILFTGRMPRWTYRFGVAMLRWSTRVEAYMLLLHDVYPPFAFELP